jgi:carboxynorspermidine decarboxylase
VALTAEKSIQDFVEGQRTRLQTPYYLIDETRLLKNLEKIAHVRQACGAKCVLALKCFSTWRVFELLRRFMDGTTSSSLYEARLGHEKFGKEVHAYSVAFSEEEMRELRRYATKIIFNSLSQLKRFAPLVRGIPLGLRVNPGVSHSEFDLADPARKGSRLGALDPADISEAASLISGVMFHCNCENADFDDFRRILTHISENFTALLRRVKWVSLGGGIYFTLDGYPLEAFCGALSDFASRFDVQVYLEPGETVVTGAGYLVTQVLDIVRNEGEIAIVDAAVETHMLDLLIYRTNAKIESVPEKGFPYTLAGRTCLAGDIFGSYLFPEKLQVGSLIAFADAAGYTLVKKNWFNGVAMPSIVIRRLDGRVEVVKRFEYQDYLESLS